MGSLTSALAIIAASSRRLADAGIVGGRAVTLFARAQPLDRVRTLCFEAVLLAGLGQCLCNDLLRRHPVPVHLRLVVDVAILLSPLADRHAFAVLGREIDMGGQPLQHIYLV